MRTGVGPGTATSPPGQPRGDASLIVAQLERSPRRLHRLECLVTGGPPPYQLLERLSHRDQRVAWCTVVGDVGLVPDHHPVRRGAVDAEEHRATEVHER